MQIALLLDFFQSIPQFFSALQLRDIFDILVVALLLYSVLFILKRTHSAFIFAGFGILLAVYIIARIFNLYLTAFLFQGFFTFFVIIFVIIFQRELRNFFEFLSFEGGLAFKRRTETHHPGTTYILQAVSRLSNKKIGALIVLPGEQPLERFLEGGVAIDGRISAPLLLSIFDPASPGHDGAMIIEKGRIKRFGVHLPLADRFMKSKSMGTRHRAALGLSERSDAFIIVVSEEKGTISVACDGELEEVESIKDLQERIHSFFKGKASMAEIRRRPSLFFVQNLREKILAVILAFFFWYIFIFSAGVGIISREISVPVEVRAVPEEYVIDKVAPAEITLTLQGRTQAFDIADLKNAKVVIDLATSTEGINRILLNKDTIQYPSSLSLVEFSPAAVLIELELIPTEEPEEESEE